MLFDTWRNKTMPVEAYTDVIYAAARTDDQMVVDAVKFEYAIPYVFSDTPRYRDILDDVIGDSHFLCPVIEFSNVHVGSGHKLYQYHYLHRSDTNPWPEWMGAIHGYEIDFVFGLPLNDSYSYTDEEKLFSQRIITYWSNFAKSGNPNTASTSAPSPEEEEWPEYDVEERRYLEMDVSGSVVKQGLRNRQCQFWKNYLPELKESLNHESNPTCGSTSLLGAPWTHGVLTLIVALTSLQIVMSNSC